MNLSKFLFLNTVGIIVFILVSCKQTEKISENIEISGIYPHLAYYNEAGECGTGAVVPWADRLWVINYGQHFPYGSADKLYEITNDLNLITRPESTGGTPANRMIHRESNQLFIGPYAIDSERNVRVIPYKDVPGRHTGMARHITHPDSKIYLATMEEGFYELDVNTLESKILYSDFNADLRPEGYPVLEKKLADLPGAHGKGLYSGQGVLVYSNNGERGQAAKERFDVESGSLTEWDGSQWKLIRRNQFTEVTGPGGIYGNPNPDSDPIWTNGFDYKSVLIGVRQNNEWRFFRIPKASFSYDGAHGWNTEWPRIRNIGTDDNPDYLMTMHGMFWKFPKSFSINNTAGIRPRSAYLKVIGDFATWNNKIVFGTDDAAKNEFLNKRNIKGEIGGAGQSNSNLWFVSNREIDNFGKNDASGYVWLRENISANNYSEPFLFTGWENRTVWIKNESEKSVLYTFEIDKDGKNQWNELIKIDIPANSSNFYSFNNNQVGEWIRVKTDNNTFTTVGFIYTSNEKRQSKSDVIFDGLAKIGTINSQNGLLYGLGNNKKSLGLLASDHNGEVGYYEVDEKIGIKSTNNDSIANFMRTSMNIPSQVVNVEKGSVLIVDNSGRRWKLPLGDEKFTRLTNATQLRICREVVTERDLLNCHGTFYELPAENADGFAKIRPISSHNLQINDYASYRGLLVMTGINPTKSKKNQRIFNSSDNKASLWVGAIDDLWKLGKPVGSGGPWVNSKITANEYSDPFLFGFYDKRIMQLSHNLDKEVEFNVQIDPAGDNEWMNYKTFLVKPGEKIKYEFPKSISGRWVRLSTNIDAEATAWFNYQ